MRGSVRSGRPQEAELAGHQEPSEREVFRVDLEFKMLGRIDLRCGFQRFLGFVGVFPGHPFRC